ncbi:MAG: flavodoxin reductase [Balneolia bacterium]|nr:flavodoxin reductase [Balneolia bacterium]
MSAVLKIISITQLTHDVRQIRVEKPEGYSYEPGQATEVAVNKQGWKEEFRPFTFTSLTEENYLEFVIKSYSSHDGVTEQIGKLKEGDELIIKDAWGAISYKGSGVFLAGGAGITPFIAIFRDLKNKGKLAGNTLIFSNKTSRDVILEDEFRELLGDDFISVITDEKPGYESSAHRFLGGHIDRDFLKQNIDDFSQSFYVCGPEAFNEAMIDELKELGASPDSLVFEE